jgi:Bacterial extracellular solute-binding protein
MRAVLFSFVLAAAFLAAQPRVFPPWSRGANNPASDKGYEFQVPDIDNVPDLHGNPNQARLVLFVGGNQFMVMPALIRAFEAEHPDLRGRIFYETLPPGILRRQIAANGTITLGNFTLQAQADVFEAGLNAVWASEVAFQEQIGNQIAGVKIRAAQNSDATYSAAVLKNSPHREAATPWLSFLLSISASNAYAAYGFKPVTAPTGK